MFSFIISLLTSRKGCARGGPIRACMRATSTRSIPRYNRPTIAPTIVTTMGPRTSAARDGGLLPSQFSLQPPRLLHGQRVELFTIKNRPMARTRVD